MKNKQQLNTKIFSGNRKFQKQKYLYFQKKIEKSMLTLTCDSNIKKAGEFDHQNQTKTSNSQFNCYGEKK